MTQLIICHCYLYIFFFFGFSIPSLNRLTNVFKHVRVIIFTTLVPVKIVDDEYKTYEKILLKFIVILRK